MEINHRITLLTQRWEAFKSFLIMITAWKCIRTPAAWFQGQARL